jgi:hypothetical protein
MYTNPNLLDHMAKDHQRRLLREAEMERLARQARMDRPSHLMRLRLLASALLSRMGHGGQSQAPGKREQAGALSQARNRTPISAHSA